MSLANQLSKVDLNLLTVLDALLRERNVTRAAQELGLSQPATSNALARLRELFSDPLLVRSRQGMQPTPRALALEIPLRDALARLASTLLPDLAFEPSTARTEFVLAATDYVQFVLLSGLMKRLATAAPQVVLHVVPMAEGTASSELENGTIDLVLSGVSSLQQGLHRRALFHDRVVSMLSSTHPFARAPLTLERYLGLPHVEVLTGRGPSLADQSLANIGHTRKLALTLPHFLVAPFVMAESAYCFTLAERIALPMAKLLPLTVLPLPFDVPRVTIWSYWHERKHRDPGHAFLRRTIAELAAHLESESRKPKPGRPRTRKMR